MGKKRHKPGFCPAPCGVVCARALQALGGMLAGVGGALAKLFPGAGCYITFNLKKGGEYMSDEKQAGAALVAALRRGCVGGELVREIVPNAVYDTAAAGAVLHRSARWVARMCAAGRIAGVNNNGWRVSGSALLAFLQGK